MDHTDGGAPTALRTRGAASLALWMTGTGRDPVAVATILACDASAVRRWLAGERVPRLDMRARIACLAHVTPDQWERTDGVAEIDEARRAIEAEREAVELAEQAEVSR